MNRYGILILALILAWGAAFGQAGRKKVHQGNKLYAEKKYDGALAKYQDALIENPNSSVAQFNVGDAAYKKSNWDKALEFFGKTLRTESVPLQSKTYYNTGNALYRQGKLAESIQAYEQALKLDPNDLDAKYNLEFVRAKLKQNAQPQNSPQQNQQEEQRQQEQKKQQNQQKQQNQDNQKQQQRKPEMSKEQAEQLLNALNEDQKKTKREQAAAAGAAAVEKD
ncbi:MAG TPA: tetratricopeptide repeat protein, partial [bacterium]